MKGQAQEECSTELKELMSCWTGEGKKIVRKLKAGDAGGMPLPEQKMHLAIQCIPRLSQNPRNGSQSKPKKLKAAVENLYPGNAQEGEQICWKLKRLNTVLSSCDLIIISFFFFFLLPYLTRLHKRDSGTHLM